MIDVTTGDLFESDAEALVNTVNCVGVMGRGLALQFKRRFPANFAAYAKACARGEVRIGSMFVVERTETAGPRYIINFPTKRHWRSKSKLEDVDRGLVALAAEIEARGITSVAIPPLGSGLGGLNWLDVRALIDERLASVDAAIIVYEPAGPPSAVVSTTTPPNWTRGRALLVALMDRYLRGLVDPHISLLEIHKLMYFAQLAGEPLRLSFRKHYYGPYADNLRHVMKRIDGHFTNGYLDGGDDPTKLIELLPGSREKAAEVLAKTGGEVLERVATLVDGFETPQSMELLATVCWVGNEKNGATSAEEATRRVHAWNDRKRMFTPQQVAIAWDVLQSQGWLTPPIGQSSSASPNFERR